MFQGLRTVIYHVGDLHKAKEWYSEVLGFGPYFDEPFYVGFNVGGYELGLQPREGSGEDGQSDAPGAAGAAGVASSAPGAGEPSVVAYWGVADARAAVKRVLELGARSHRDVQDVGDGILVATVLDPFGNAFGIIENPHFTLPR